MKIWFRWGFAVIATAAHALAQLGPAGGGGAGTRAQQLPLSGRSAISTEGSVATDEATFAEPLTLTLVEAVRRGLQYNLGAVASGAALRSAEAGRLSARSQLLPDIGGDLREVVQQTNLAAAGLRFSGFSLGPGLPAFAFPRVVGPYNYFDLRASLSQPVVDIVRIHNYRSSQETAKAAGLSAQDSRELIVQAVTGAYLQVVATQSRVDTARAQVVVATATHTQAVDRNKSGLNARIDVNRSLVELQTQQQRLNSLLNDFAKQKIAFARLIGLSQAQSTVLTDRQPFAPGDPLASVDELIQQAWETRADVRTAAAQVRAAEEAHRAANSEYLPSLSLSADYGVIGVNPSQAHGTFSVTGSLHIPIYRGGRQKADVEQANATLGQRRAELADIRGRAEQDVRNARLDLETAAAQITLAESSRRLAAETLEQARDRFNAGVADTIEVVQAQESVASAEQDYISAMLSYQLARVGLSRATGGAEKSIR